MIWDDGTNNLYLIHSGLHLHDVEICTTLTRRTLLDQLQLHNSSIVYIVASPAAAPPHLAWTPFALLKSASNFPLPDLLPRRGLLGCSTHSVSRPCVRAEVSVLTFVVTTYLSSVLNITNNCSLNPAFIPPFPSSHAHSALSSCSWSCAICSPC